jgi:hypothetical protein
MTEYIAFPKAMSLLTDGLGATQEELAIWLFLTPKHGGLTAYTGDNELDQPPKFNFGHYFNTKNYHTILLGCWFKAVDIAKFKPKERYITGVALLERWKNHPNNNPEEFIKLKIQNFQLTDLHPTYGLTIASNPGSIGFPPLEDGLFQLSSIEAIEASELTPKKPDWNIWSNIVNVTPWEGTALTINIDPDTYQKQLSPTKWEVLTSLIPSEIKLKYDAALNHFGENRTMPMREFAIWAQSQGWRLPKELSDRINPPSEKELYVDKRNENEIYQSAKDIKDERGCRRQIREHWDKIQLLHGNDANARQVLRVIERNTDSKNENIPTLKTVQNKLKILRDEGLIP